MKDHRFDRFKSGGPPIDHDRQLTREQQKDIERRGKVISSLISEIEASNDSIITLYASLLARTLAATDEILLREYSQRLEEMVRTTRRGPGHESRC
jgi:hypothetical protein